MLWRREMKNQRSCNRSIWRRRLIQQRLCRNTRSWEVSIIVALWSISLQKLHPWVEELETQRSFWFVSLSRCASKKETHLKIAHYWDLSEKTIVLDYRIIAIMISESEPCNVWIFSLYTWGVKQWRLYDVL